MANATRWAGVPLSDRRADRRARLIDAAFAEVGGETPGVLSVRSVCRACGFNTRYFYESFTGVDELLGAVYDDVARDLAEEVAAAVTAAGRSARARTAAGIRAVLGFCSQDVRRGRILFTHDRANPVLAERRAATEELLMTSVLAETLSRQQISGGRGRDVVSGRVAAAMYTGAMTALAEQWIGGHLGDDLDEVVTAALTFILR
jgi:AcrR family transcriptional regulator